MILNKAFLVSVQNFLHDSPLMLEIQTNACHKLSHFRKKFKKMQVTNFFINSRVLTNSDLKFQARVQKLIRHKPSHFCKKFKQMPVTYFIDYLRSLENSRTICLLQLVFFIPII